MQGDAVIDIKLRGVKPRVSRRIQVPLNLRLNRFHEVIQVVMGWENSVAHVFGARDDNYGDLRQFVGPFPSDERKAWVCDLFVNQKDTATYVYDLDEEWIHELLLADFAEPESRPVLLAGTGACPIEGLGGAYAYEQFKAALKDRSEPLWKINPDLMRSFRGFDPKAFSVGAADQQLEELSSRWRKKSRAQPRPKCRSIVLVDAEPIRSRHRKNLEQARFELQKLEAELERFKGIDSSLFRNWVHNTFPVKMSLLRELHEESARLVSRLHLMHEFQEHGVKSPGDAYRRAVRVEEGTEPMPDFPPPKVSADSEIVNEQREYVRETMKALAGEIGLATDSLDEEVDAFLEEQLTGRPAETDSRQECRSIYRKIALRLHPDRGGKMTEAEAQIWYRAQEAYTFSDVLGLRQLWSQLTKYRNENLEISCAEMIAAFFETKAQITSLDHLRRSLKRELAWNFSRLTEKQLQARQVRLEKDLRQQEQASVHRLAELRAACNRLAALQTRWEAGNRSATEQQYLF
jgi:Plasmid pRiA4b ORF-3-like protein